MAPYIDAYVAPMLLVACLSHIAQPKLWAEFFRVLRRTGVAPLIIGMYTLPLGLLIVVGHNQWAWDWPVLITIVGWAMTVKAVISLRSGKSSPTAPQWLPAWRNRMPRNLWLRS